MPGREALAYVLGKMKRKCVGIMPVRFVNVPEHLAFGVIQVDRNIHDRIAFGIKIAKYVASRDG